MIAHGGEKRLDGLARQILDHAVVGQHLDLIVGKRDREHRTAARAVAQIGPGHAAAVHLVMRARGAGGPVMAVGDVEHVDRLESGDEAVPVSRVDAPERVPDVVRRLKIDERLAGRRS